jgi:hypothetical protein
MYNFRLRAPALAAGKPGYVYHPFKMPGARGRRLDEGGGAMCNGYFGEPSGWQFQLDGEYGPGR